MPEPAPSVRPALSRVQMWIGRALAAPPVLLLLFSAYMKLSRNPQAVEGIQKFGYPDGSLLPIGIAEVAGTVLYLIPRTCVFGAVFLTAYLGGATNHHVRAGELWFAPVVVAVLLWTSLLLREPRLRALLPIRRA